MDAIDRALTLHGSLTSLRKQMAAEAAATCGLWGIDGDPGLSNLADYLALRSADLRPLQDDLAALGLSTLGRCESHVGPSLAALSAALAALAGLAPEEMPAVEAFSAGRRRISAARDTLFGMRAGASSTRIMVTLPTEAATDPALVADLVAAGADCLRINCAHDDASVWSAMIENIGAAGRAAGRRVPVAMDLGGPKLRIAGISPGSKLHLWRGDRFLLADAAETAGEPTAILSHPELLDRLEPGSEVWIDDGKLGARVISRRGRSVLCQVTAARAKGVKLRAEKGVNFPGLEIGIPALTEEDLGHLDFVATHADLIGYSFVQTTEDVRRLQAAVAERLPEGRAAPALMLKIETRRAVHNLPRLIVQAAAAGPVAVMIARGDLAVEIGLERLSEIQEEILWLCEAAQVPVVWATQVLESLLKDGHATRAETTDAAMGQRADCVMLNKGPFAVEGVGFLDRILHRMDRHQTKKMARLAPLMSWQEPQTL